MTYGETIILEDTQIEISDYTHYWNAQVVCPPGLRPASRSERASIAAALHGSCYVRPMPCQRCSQSVGSAPSGTLGAA